MEFVCYMAYLLNMLSFCKSGKFFFEYCKNLDKLTYKQLVKLRFWQVCNHVFLKHIDFMRQMYMQARAMQYMFLICVTLIVVCYA